MEKKRSKGVTFWGWIFIIFGIIGVLGALNPQQTIKLYGSGLFFLSIVLSIATIIAGIFVLKLNETARKAVIVLGFISIISIPFWFAPVFKSSYMQESYAKKRQYIIEKVKPEYQQKALDDLDKVNKASEKALPIIITIFFGVPILILEILPIIFFTRQKVKEQFS
ncbi:MAG: hypothetical protein V2A59_02890 [Candidatus Omnitrophota bacterium]